MKKPLIPHLFRTKRFYPVFLAHLTGALNDNMFRVTLIAVLSLRLTSFQTDTIAEFLAAVVACPLLICSFLAGQFADKYNRDVLVRKIKLAELIVICAAILTAFLNIHSLLIVCLFLLGCASAFFMPVKYALLPQHLNTRDLIAANAYFEIASGLSMALATWLALTLPVSVSFVLLLLCAAGGYSISKYVPESAGGRPDLQIDKNFFSENRASLRMVKKHPVLFRSILGSSWFTALATLLIIKLLPMCQTTINAKMSVYAFFLFMMAAGFGVGCFMSKRMMRGVLHTTYVPLSAIGLGGALCLIYYFSSDYPTASETMSLWTFFMAKGGFTLPVSLAIFGFCGGMYIVPLNVVVQQKAAPEYIGTILSAEQVCLFSGVVLITLFSYLCSLAGISTPVQLLIIAFADLFIAIYICTLLPADLLRSIIRSIVGFCFSVKIKGLDNFNAAGKRVIIVANHTSLLDGLLIAAFLPDRLTFAIGLEWVGKWYIKVLNLLVDLIPIDQTNPMALRTVIEEIKKNKKVVIFPEGRISVTGSLMKIHEAMGMVAEKTKARILPICIAGAQYSKFSYAKDRFSSQYFPKITLTILPPRDFSVEPEMKSREKRLDISNRLYDVMADMMYRGARSNENIFVSILKARDTHGWRNVVFEDATRKKMNYGSFVTKSYVLGRAFATAFPQEEKIGVMLPNVLATPVVVFGLMSVDKIPVMLNFSSGPAQVSSCVKTTALKTVLTSKKFVEMGHLEHLIAALEESGVSVVYLERFAKTISTADKLKGVLDSLSSRKPKNSPDGPAVILFTSGSEGLPKAVVLSHRNIHANRNQYSAILAFDKKDVVFNALPLFHSFGLCLGTIMPVVSGMKCFLYPTPLHYRVIPQLVYEIDATIMAGTDTFVANYAKAAHPYDFYRIKYVAVGGEKLKESTSELWLHKFGVRLVEGYGTTEAAPLVAANSPMHTKAGTVGRLLPGIESRLEHIEGYDKGGKLWIRGENLMLGYMKADLPNVLQPLKDGWYDTGDIVDIDPEGFITITGRAKRFAKIGGEMVSLTAVEQMLDKMVPGYIYGVVAINDDKKGEQLILMTNNPDISQNDVTTFFKQNGISELWIPKKIHFMEELPVLGIGKIDYVSAKKIAEEIFS